MPCTLQSQNFSCLQGIGVSVEFSLSGWSSDINIASGSKLYDTTCYRLVKLRNIVAVILAPERCLGPSVNGYLQECYV